MKRILAFMTVFVMVAILYAGVPVCADYSLIDIPLPTPTPDAEAEVIASAGLIDMRSAADIADGLRDGVTEYQVRSRAGMQKLAMICADGTALGGYTFFQTADIDMEWIPFRGIGVSAGNNGFRGIFDGNGFVIRRLFVSGQTTDRGAGLFNESFDGIFRNIGIASGLIFGRNAVGAILGHSSGAPAIVNCWNAATVISNGNRTAGECFGPGGIVGRTSGSVINCYNLGLIVSTMGSQLGGVSGRQHAGVFTNNYNYGQLVAGYLTSVGWSQNRLAPGFNALLSANADAGGENFTASNNFYRIGCGELSLNDGNGDVLPGETDPANVIAMNDNAVGFSESGFTTLGAYLNAGNPTAAAGAHADGYSVAFKNIDRGYPALIYKKGTKVIVKRFPAEEAFNIGPSLDFTDPNGAYYSSFFTAMKARAATENTSAAGFTVSDDVTEDAAVSNAMDLLLLAAFTNDNNKVIRNVTVFDDIDCAQNPITRYMIPLFYNAGLHANCTFDGQDHTIRNLNMDLAENAYSASHVGFISALGENAELRDLALESGNITVEYTDPSADRGVGVLAGAAGAGAIIARCRTNVALAMTGSTNTNARVSAICANGAGAFTIDHCRNTGPIVGVSGGRVGVLSDAPCSVNVYNSFNSGTVSGAAARRLVSAAPGTECDFNNLWDVSGSLTAITDHYSNAATSVFYDEMIESAPLDAESYENGQLAYYLNHRFVFGKGTRQYYKAADGKTVFGSGEEAPVKVTFMISDREYAERYTDPAGSLIEEAPQSIPVRMLRGWKNAGGETVDPEETIFTEDTVLYADAAAADAVNAALRDVVQLKMLLDLDFYEKTVVKVTVTGPNALGKNGAESIHRDFVPGEDGFTKGADGRYPIEWPVAAAQMTDPIRIAVTYSESNDEEEILAGYSVKEYLETLKNFVSDSLTVSLCNDALQYGACAQKAFGYNTDNPAAVVSTSADDWVPAAEEYNNTVVFGSKAGAGLEKVSTSALLRDRVALRMYITPIEADDVFTASYSKNGADAVALDPVKLKDGRYMLTIPGIAAADFGTPYTFTVNNETRGTAYSLRTGVLNYGKKLLASDPGSGVTDEMKVLICAMKAYHQAALNYFDLSN